MRTQRGPNVWHLDRVRSVPQIDLSARADRKNGHFVCVSVYLHKENTILQNRYTDKKIRWFSFVCEGKTFAHRPMRICVSVCFLKKSKPYTDTPPPNTQ